MDSAPADGSAEAIRSASVHALWVRARVSRDVGACHDDVELPLHRAFYLSFRHSTVLTGATMHSDVMYPLRCHQMGKHRASDLRLASLVLTCFESGDTEINRRDTMSVSKRDGIDQKNS